MSAVRASAKAVDEWGSRVLSEATYWDTGILVDRLGSPVNDHNLGARINNVLLSAGRNCLSLKVAC